MPFSILESIRFQLAILLLSLFALLAGASGYALHSAEQRRAEQAVLGEATRLQLAAHLMREQALNYMSTPARDYPTYFRDVKLYYRDLRNHMATLDEALGPGGRLPASSDRARSQTPPEVREAARIWRSFREQLNTALGDDPDEPRLEFAAEHIIAEGDALEQATRTLYQAFEATAQGGMANHQRMVRIAVVTALVVLVLSGYWLQSRILRPLNRAIAGFQRVSQGDFGHQVLGLPRNEIGWMTTAFNGLSQRIQTLFRLIDRVQQAPDSAAMLASVWEELGTFVPLDWAGLLVVAPDGETAVLEHAFPAGPETPKAAPRFPLPDHQVDAALDSTTPLRIPDLESISRTGAQATFEAMLADQRLRSVLFLPIQGAHFGKGLLVLASRQPNAYRVEHQELLNNLSGFIAHALKRHMDESEVNGRPPPERATG